VGQASRRVIGRCRHSHCGGPVPARRSRVPTRAFA
jgi:hypothetical protein